MIVMNKEIYEDLFKNVVINGHYPFEKLNEIKSYIKTLNTKIENLEQQCKKQKEVIDNAIEYVEHRIVEDDYMLKVDTDMVQKELLDILNEAE